MSNPLQKGSSLVLWVETDTEVILGSDAIGELKKTSERVGEEASQKLWEEISAKPTVDVHLADLILPYVALAPGESVYLTRTMSEHLETNIWLAEEILKVKFKTEKTDGLNDYDRQKNRTWKSSRGFGKEVFEEILRGLKNCQKKLLLEVGVGSGRNVKPVLERINLYLVGLDLSKEMLRTARTKLIPHKQSFDLILGDAEHLPFVDETLDAILCMSTMHYFTDQERILGNFRQLLKRNGVFIYGDLSPQESDDEEFLETLERTISKAHARYYKASEINWLMEKNGFHVNRTRTIDYRKSYDA
jgi:ubiquinone/menaquinone biosynthesis C-methylase UbiE